MSLAIPLALGTANEISQLQVLKWLVQFHHAPHSSRPAVLKDVGPTVMNLIKPFRSENVPIAFWVNPSRAAQVNVVGRGIYRNVHRNRSLLKMKAKRLFFRTNYWRAYRPCKSSF
jgi:hypothetical protein